MTAQSPGAEDPIKYTKESLTGLYEVWLSFGKARFSQAAAAIEQFADKLPAPLKRKSSQPSAASNDTHSANAPS